MTNPASILDEVKGLPLSSKERAEKAVQLAALLLEEAQEETTESEARTQKQLAGLMDDSKGKAFTTALTDQAFRSNRSLRVADQVAYLIDSYGIPRFLSKGKKIALKSFRAFGKSAAPISIPLLKKFIRFETSEVIIPGELQKLSQHIAKRRAEGVKVNLNRLGEAILGEEEANARLSLYLSDLANPEIDYISVKISTLCSQINLLAWDETLKILSKRLRTLFRAAKNKFVNLDMEEYRDLHLTVALFRILDEPEFLSQKAGIVLQAYLPDSYPIQQDLTSWALKRVAKGGAPIKIRLVKGANLAMEQVEASIKNWEQAPYSSKVEVDANFKRMMIYGLEKQHAEAVHIGIGSHNLFDIAYALLLRSENRVEPFVTFEMLEGMADPLRRVIQKTSQDMLLYTPAALKKEFQTAIAYLIRRLDENSGPENFLRHAFNLKKGTKAWQNQVDSFLKSCEKIETASSSKCRTQNRMHEIGILPIDFANEADTDWSFQENRLWIEKALKEPIHPDIPVTHDFNLIDQILDKALRARSHWAALNSQERARRLSKVALALKKNRSCLIRAMVFEGKKTVPEADSEVSEAIDFAGYYPKTLLELESVSPARFIPKGTILVAPPWNFPCSIPAGGVLAALSAGNTVVLKPAAESRFVSLELCRIFWEAGIDEDVLQFIACDDEPFGSCLVKDERISAVVLTGATATAKKFLCLKPGLDLIAETGGKNAVILTSLCDRDLAIKDVIQSAFGHSGQKCSACSLLILEGELYNDPNFKHHLKDAAASLKVGSAWDMASKVIPLIKPPSDALLKGLTELDPGEEWLLKPIPSEDPCLWSPGIKWGVQEGSFTHQTELFGPVLGVMPAKDLKHAIRLANGTPYGLTSGIHTLDEREKAYWLEHIEAGNCYINRSITGAIVRRQPFGGCKESSFGLGFKAGGPNYLLQFLHIEEADSSVQEALDSYQYFWNAYFSKEHDPSRILGESNRLKYVPHCRQTVRFQKGDNPEDLLKSIGAAQICKTPLEISINHPPDFPLPLQATIESEEAFISRLGKIKRVRLFQPPSQTLKNGFAFHGCNVHLNPVSNIGRFELLHYLREVSISHSYHRYGYIECDSKMEI